MAIRRVVLALAVFILAVAGLAAQTPAPAPAAAESLFVAARFADASAAFAARYAADSTDWQAALRLGQIALFHNRFADAERWLGRAIALKPDDPAPKVHLAEAHSRRDRFADALPLLVAANRAVRAQKLEGFAGRAPHRLGAGADETRLPFVFTDPLPLVVGSVNGSDTLFLLIDTGGGELVLDSAVATRVGAQRFGVGLGTFAGGQAPVTDARVDSLRLGAFTLHDVPVRILNTRQFAAVFGGHRVDGVIGTVLLYHFLTTLDYPGGQLILRRRTPAALAAFERDAAARRATTLPFWLAGDHFMFTWGSVNGHPARPLFVDTGLAGGGFVCSDSTARSFGIDMTRATTTEGVGGAGRTQVNWFMVDSLRLGDAVGRDIRGAVGQLRFRQSFGFDAAGIISHAFFRPYALTFDFDGMRMFLTRE